MRLRLLARLCALPLALALVPAAPAQTTLTFNANYPVNPGDPEPRTVVWSDPRNWGGTLPGAADHVVLNEASYLESTFTVGSLAINTTSIFGSGGSLEVLGKFEADTSDGPVTFFNALTLRGQSTVGGLTPASTNLNLYRNLDNYGDLTLAGTHHAPLTFSGGDPAHVPTLTNHTGATLSFSTGTITGSYARFVNAAGATLRKTGTGEATLSFGNNGPAFDHHGSLLVQGGQLTVTGARDWDAGAVALSPGTHLRFNFALPTGEISFSGTGRISALGDGNTGNTTLKFAAASTLTLDDFKPYNLHNLTIDGPITLQDVALPTDGLLTFRGTPVIDLTGSATSGLRPSSLGSTVRNEGTLSVAGNDYRESYLTAGSTFTNADGATLALVGDVRLANPATTLVNRFGATIAHGSGFAPLEWKLDNSGTLAVIGGTLGLSEHGTWTPGSALSLGQGGTVLFTGNNSAPVGTTALTGPITNPGGNVEFGTGILFQNDFSLAAVPGSGSFNVFFTGSDGYRPGIDAGATLSLSGPIRVWGAELRSFAPLGSPQPATLHLGDGITLARDNSNPVFGLTGNARLLTTGNVTLHADEDTEFWPSSWLNTGTLTKTGAQTFRALNLTQHGHVDVLAGVLDLGAAHDWTGGTADIASGATLRNFEVLPDGGLFRGQGTIGLNSVFPFDLVAPSSTPGDYTLPFAAGSHLTLTGARWAAEGAALIVNADTDFVGNRFIFDRGLVLNADTHWGPRTGTVADAGSNFLSGTVENHADATLRGTLAAKDLASANSDRVAWDNRAGSTFTLHGADNAPGRLAQTTEDSMTWVGSFRNRAGALFTAGFGGARVEWYFDNQGTIRVLNGETLTTTRAGSWDGGRVELFQSYVNFRQILPSGDFTVTGQGDLGFGAATRGTTGTDSRETVIVPTAGTTIRNAPSPGGTLFDLGLYGDLSGPGRLTLYGDRFVLEPTYYAPRGGFVPRSYTNWSNAGGVELRGTLSVPNGQSLTLDFTAGLDVYGELQLTHSMLMAPVPLSENPTPFIRIQSGGTLALGASGYVNNSGGSSGTHLVNLAGGTVLVTGQDAGIRGLFDNLGTVRIAGGSLTTDGGNWSGGRVEFVGGDNQITLISAPSSGAVFSGPGRVVFGSGVDLAGRSYRFEQAGPNPDFSPVIDLTSARFATPNSPLHLGGSAVLRSLTFAGDSAGSALDLAGQFRVLPNNDDGQSFNVGFALVRNFGAVDTLAPPGATNPVSNLRGDAYRGTVWQNMAGSSLTLAHGTDLGTYLSDAVLFSGNIPRLINEAGARLIATGAFGDGRSDIGWNVTNRGEVIARDSALLRFTAGLVNESTGTFRVETGGQIDFGLNVLTLADQFTSNGGRIQAQQFIVDHSVTPTTTSLTIAAGAVTFANNATLNAGGGTLEFLAPINGTGTLAAGTVSFVGGGTLLSTAPGAIVVDGNLTFADSTTVNFGAGSTLTVANGSLTGTGTVQADTLVFRNHGGVTTLAGGGSLVLRGEVIRVEGGAIAHFGTSNVQVFSPISGTGTIEAGSIVWNAGTYVSSGTSALTFHSPVTILSSGQVLFGNTSTITFAEGLGGTGTFAADTFTVSGTVTPGSSPGTLAFVGNTTFDANSAFTFELGTAAQDLITVDGNLTLAGTVNVTALPTFVAGTYTLFTSTGALLDQGLTLGALPDGFAANLFTTAHRLDLVVTGSAVPEPSTYALLAGLATLLATRCSRRRRQ